MRTLDEKYVNEVIEMVNNGMTTNDIARVLDTKPANIEYIRHTRKDRITFSRYKGGRISRTINLPPVKEEKNVYETTDVLMLAEREVLLAGIKTNMWYKIKGDKISVMSKSRENEITISGTELHAFIEELMRLSAVMPKFSVDNLEAY